MSTPTTLRRRVERLEAAREAGAELFHVSDEDRARLSARIEQLHHDLEHGTEREQAHAERGLIRFYRTIAEDREQQRAAGQISALGPESEQADQRLQTFLAQCRAEEAAGRSVPQAVHPWRYYLEKKRQGADLLRPHGGRRS